MVFYGGSTDGFFMVHTIFNAVKKRRLIVAHRGARSLAPENTLAAARLALAAGAAMWEIDVRLSRDGEPVLVHDFDLKRISDAQDKFPGGLPGLLTNLLCRNSRPLISVPGSGRPILSNRLPRAGYLHGNSKNIAANR